MTAVTEDARGEARAQREAAYVEAGLWDDERLGWLAYRAAREFPDREFLCIDDLRLTYREFTSWATAIAADLVARGVRRGDRVLVQLPNRVEALLAQVAAFRIGAVSVPVVPIYREHEMSHIVADCRPVAVIAGEDTATRQPCAEFDRHLAGAGLFGTVRYVVGEATVPGWAPFPRRPDGPQDDTGLPEPLEPEACALILYTSGTTSAPKGVMLTGRAFVANNRSVGARMAWTEDEVFFCCAPLSHLAGFVSGFAWPVSVGARVVIMPKWDGDAAADLIERERVTFTTGAAVFLHDLVRSYRKGMGASHRITRFVSGGAATPPVLIREADSLGVHAMRGYGMTETGGGITFPGLDSDLERRANYDGRLIDGTELEAVDPYRQPLSPGVEGELRTRGPQSLIGYTDPDLTAAQVDEDGWFYTGDVGTVDAEGWLRVTGRIKDIINRGGEKFSARDIEEAIVAHPDIDRAAVVGVPDERFGEAVAAFVTLAPGVIWTDPDSVLRHLETSRLTKQKFPTEWYVVDELPATASGKIQKHLLLERRTVVSTNRKWKAARGT
ncbi:class I adenylate-forming enzyme family protein [Phytohabitans kaempferiae]|uniref:Class I adenylate-forming enzyme family protein n=1 Tax=Phytohabitans kaempferiae TaxID=1620943 RepID=A0ABV6M335_9ACTN